MLADLDLTLDDIKYVNNELAGIRVISPDGFGPYTLTHQCVECDGKLLGRSLFDGLTGWVIDKNACEELYYEIDAGEDAAIALMNSGCTILENGRTQNDAD